MSVGNTVKYTNGIKEIGRGKLIGQKKKDGIMKYEIKSFDGTPITFIPPKRVFKLKKNKQ
jgi:hypothetical protein